MPATTPDTAPRTANRGPGQRVAEAMNESSRILRALARRWWLMAVMVLLGVGGGAVYTMLAKPVYAASAYVVVVSNTPDPSVATGFAQAYGRILGQSTILSEVMVPGGTPSSGELQGAVQTSTSPDAPMIQITATAAAPQRAADIVNAVANALVTYGNGRTAQTHASLSIFAAAAAPSAPTSPQPTRDVAVGLAAGVLLGAMAMLAGVGQGAGPRQARPDLAPANGYPPMDWGSAGWSSAIVDWEEDPADAHPGDPHAGPPPGEPGGVGGGGARTVNGRQPVAGHPETASERP